MSNPSRPGPRPVKERSTEETIDFVRQSIGNLMRLSEDMQRHEVELYRRRNLVPDDTTPPTPPERRDVTGWGVPGQAEVIKVEPRFPPPPAPRQQQAPHRRPHTGPIRPPLVERQPPEVWHRGHKTGLFGKWRCIDCGIITAPPRTPPPNHIMCHQR